MDAFLLTLVRNRPYATHSLLNHFANHVAHHDDYVFVSRFDEDSMQKSSVFIANKLRACKTIEKIASLWSLQVLARFSLQGSDVMMSMTSSLYDYEVVLRSWDARRVVKGDK